MGMKTEPFGPISDPWIIGSPTVTWETTPEFNEFMGEVNSQDLIAEECDLIKEILLEKNRKYGDAALNPQQIFSRSDPTEQIRVRLDDKLNRIKNRQNDEDEDVILDLIGYLILLRVAERVQASHIS